MLLQRFRRMEVFGRRDFLRGDVAQKRAHRGILPIRRKSGRGGVEFLTSRITAVFFLTHTFSHLEAEQKVLSQAQGAVLRRRRPAGCRVLRSKQESSIGTRGHSATHPPGAASTGQRCSSRARAAVASDLRHCGGWLAYRSGATLAEPRDPRCANRSAQRWPVAFANPKAPRPRRCRSNVRRPWDENRNRP